MVSSASRVFHIFELCSKILENVKSPRELLSCICLSRPWYYIVICKLYKGALTNLRFRSPDTAALSALLESSRERFAQNLAQTEHLLLFPGDGRLEHFQWISSPQYRLVWDGPFEPLRFRSNAELLLHPHSGQLKSLAMPIELIGIDPLSIRSIKEMVFAPTLRSLSIDCAYCEMFMSTTHGTKEPLPAITALTVFLTREKYKMEYLYDFIHMLDLKVFNIQRVHCASADPESKAEIKRILGSLASKENFQALALNNCEIVPVDFRGDNDFGLSPGTMPWPDLKAVYVTLVSNELCTQLCYWKSLQILSLVTGVNYQRVPFEEMGQLKVLDLITSMPVKYDSLCRILTSCPMLRYLRVSLLPTGGTLISRRNLNALLPLLPQLEVLCLDHSMELDGPMLDNIASSCPQLHYLDLGRTTINLTYASLVAMSPLWNLKVLRCRQVCIHPIVRKFMQGWPLQDFVEIWQSKFPRLRYATYLADAFFLDNGNYPDPETTPSNDESEIRKNIFDQYSLRCKISKMLNYSRNENIIERIRFKWLNDYEVSVFGWPIIPFAMYFDPKNTPPHLKRPLGSASSMRVRYGEERGLTHLKPPGRKTSKDISWDDTFGMS